MEGAAPSAPCSHSPVRHCQIDGGGTNPHKSDDTEVVPPGGRCSVSAVIYRTPAWHCQIDGGGLGPQESDDTEVVPPFGIDLMSREAEGWHHG